MKKSLTRTEQLRPLPEDIDPRWHLWHVAEVRARHLEAKVRRLRRLRVPENSRLMISAAAEAKRARLHAAKEFRFAALDPDACFSWRDGSIHAVSRQERHRTGLILGGRTKIMISRGTHGVMRSSVSLAEVLSNTKFGQRWESLPETSDDAPVPVDNHPVATS